MLLHRWRFKKRPTPPTNLAIEAYYQNVHLLLRKWMQLQLNLDFNTLKISFKMRSIVKAEVFNFQEDKASSCIKCWKTFLLQLFFPLYSPRLFCLEQSWWTDVTSYSAAKMWTKIEDIEETGGGTRQIAGRVAFICILHTSWCILNWHFYISDNFWCLFLLFFVGIYICLLRHSMIFLCFHEKISAFRNLFSDYCSTV